MVKKGFGIAGMLGEPRSGYQGGGGTGYQEYWTMVQESFINAGGQDGTGMNIQDFAEMYFPRKAEGGRIGLEGGGKPPPLPPVFRGLGAILKLLQKSGKFLNKNSPLQAYKKYLKSVKDRSIKGDYTKLGPELGIIASGGILANRWAKKKLKELDTDVEDKAEGGRIGFGEGDTPSEAYLRDIFMSIPEGDQLGSMSFQEWKNSASGQHYKDKWISEHRPKFDNGGPVTQEEYDEYVAEKEAAGEEAMDFETYKLFKIQFPMAAGGRIGFKEGQGIMSRVGDMVDVRNIPYYSGKALQGLVNSAETLSKLPFAAGELGSKLIQQPPKKEMFMKAIEDITPGSWSENVGLTSLVEGMGEKRPKDAQTVGGILGLGTEVAVPTGGAFKAGQFLLNKASKAMGKVKDGKTLNKLVEDKISDSGQSRRDFMSLVGASGLAVGLKWLGLGGVLKGATKVKPSDDVVMRLRTFIDDSDDADGVARAKWDGAFDVEGLSKAAQKTLVGIMKDIRSTRRYPEDTLKKLATGEKKNLPKSVQYYDDISPEDAPYILEALQKAGHKVKYEHIDEVGGSGVDEVLSMFKNDPIYKGTKKGAEKYKKFKEKTDKWSPRKKAEYHTSITDDWGYHINPDVEEFYDIYYGVTKKAEGGRIGLGAGGPPLQFGIAESEWKAKHPVQGNKVSQLKDAAMDRVFPGTGITGSLNMGNFEAFYNQPLIDPMNMFEKSGEPQYGLQFEKGPFEAGIGVMPSGETEYGARFKKNIDFNKMLGLHNRRQQADGGLTKTIPPKKGPMPQGLPSALYNGIMRPRSY